MYKFKRQIRKIRMKTHVSRELLFILESRDRAQKYSSPRILLIQLRQFEMNASDKNTDFSSLDHNDGNVAIA